MIPYGIPAPRNWDQEILAGVLHGKTSSDLERIIETGGINKTKGNMIKGEMKFGDQCLRWGALPNTTIQSCIDRKFYQYIAIIPGEMFNCISWNLSECNHFLQHFAEQSRANKTIIDCKILNA